MSRTKPTTTVSANPTQTWFEWNGGKGELTYWNGEERVAVEPPFKFLLLDARSTITGWSDSRESRIFSNHVENITQEEFVVRTSDGVLLQGMYSDIKDKLKGAGGKFAQSLFIMFQDSATGEFVVGNIQLKGAASGSWIDFNSENKGAIYDNAISLEGSEKKKKGAITFYVPTFALEDVTDEQVQRAEELDKVLQDYFNPNTEEVVTDQVLDDVDEEDLPF